MLFRLPLAYWRLSVYHIFEWLAISNHILKLTKERYYEQEKTQQVYADDFNYIRLISVTLPAGRLRFRNKALYF